MMMRLTSKIYVAVCRAAEKIAFLPSRQEALKNPRSFSPAIFMYGMKDSLLLFNTDPATVFVGTAAVTNMSYIEVMTERSSG